MQNFSTTQASNITAIVGLLVLILGHFHIIVDSEQITLLIGSIITAIGIIVNFIHRYQKGGVTAIGARKSD